MKIKNLISKEISHSKFSFMCCAIIICICLCSVLISLSLTKNFDKETVGILNKFDEKSSENLKSLEDQIRKEMKGLGFNIYIFPEGQDLQEVYSKGYASKTMPENYVNKLADNPTLAKINHLLPSLTQKLVWPETKRTIVLVGIKGEVPIAHKVASSKKKKPPLIDPVVKGKAVIGYELQQSLNLKKGQEITILGRKFTVEKSNEARGNADDITIWINLEECQELLGKEKQINAILALQCNCASIDRLGEIRQEVEAILPGTEVIEVKSTALARAEARMTAKQTAEDQMAIIKEQRSELKQGIEKNSLLVNAAFSLVAIITVLVFSLINVLHRTAEIGIYHSFGYKNSAIFKLIMGRAFLFGILGSLLAAILAPLIYPLIGKGSFLSAVTTGQLTLVLISGPIMACFSCLYSCKKAVDIDPVEALRDTL